MATGGLYRRVLPSPPAIEFSSPQGKEIFVEAIQSGTMEVFYKLISYFQTQSEPAFCGLASIAMVLNALAIDPGRKWKGPWRWYDESMLDCCEPLEKIKETGITFGKVVCLAQCAGARVEAYRTNHTTVEDFRSYVIKCASSEDSHIVLSYHRATFKQTGSGHFSPIGGYHAGRDMVLILDVARFKYPPHWVPLTLLWEAMDQVVQMTGQRRGFMIISRPHRNPGLLYTLSCRHENWAEIAKYLMGDVPLLLASKDVNDIKGVLSVVFTSLPSNFFEFIKWVAEIRKHECNGKNLSEEETSRLIVKEEVLKQVQETEIFKYVETLSATILCCKNLVHLGNGGSLHEIAASVCCQGAEFFSGMSGISECCCRETYMKHLKINGDKSIVVISGTIVNGDGEQNVDMLVPSSRVITRCCGTFKNNCASVPPAVNDVLTVLLLALPFETWSCLKDKKLLQEVRTLMSTEAIPALLQEEVLHLRRQLFLLKRCQENKADEDLQAPLI